MARLTRVSWSLAGVLLAYLIYARVAVPLIEPPAEAHSIEKITERDRAAAADQASLQIQQLAQLFPKGAWEALGLKNPKVLESNNAKLLIEKYSTNEDGSMEFQPCIIVFSYDGPAVDQAQRLRQSIILEAPRATIGLTERLDLNRLKIGRLKSGRLNGPITIHSDWKEPGPEDDLLITTKGDLQLAESVVTSAEPVDFRWGPHSGRGRDLSIRLLPAPSTPGKQEPGLNFSGIESFEMRHIKQLRLDPGQTGSDASNKQGGPLATTNVPVDINCSGPFFFDVLGKVATFHDQVTVVRPNAVGPPDRLDADLLSMYFVERTSSGKPQIAAKDAAPNADKKPAPAQSLDLTPERLVAQGRPAVVTAPSKNVVARGRQLEYNRIESSIRLSGEPEAFLQQGANEIHARSLYYRAGADKRLGQMTAVGPGRLRGQSPEKPEQQLDATWQGQLLIEPAEQNQHCISLSGDSHLSFGDVGGLKAEEVFFWIEEPPAGSGNTQPRPLRLLARNRAEMNSPQLCWKGQELQVWFKDGQTSRKGLAVQPVSTYPATMAGGVANGSQGKRFAVTGRLLQAQILLGEPPSVLALSLDDGVEFRELASDSDGWAATATTAGTQIDHGSPLKVTGDRLETENLSTPNATVTISGNQARMEGRGMSLSGAKINMDRGANKLWIDGPGQMDLPITKDLDGNVLAPPGVLTITWRQSMAFDGREATFRQSVVAAAPRLVSKTGTKQFRLDTETMRVQLQEPISFSQSKLQGQPALEGIHCEGGVSMENRSFDLQGNLISHDRMVVTDLGVNILGGGVVGGPGWVSSVSRGSPGQLQKGPPNIAAQPAQGSPAALPQQLYCQHVSFEKSITGNIGNPFSRRLDFADQVQVTYGPVDNFDTVLADTDDPLKLGPDGVVAHCGKLSVAQMLLPIGNHGGVEVTAAENVIIESQTYTVRAHKVTYTAAKQQLRIQGDGRNTAQLYQQAKPGEPWREVRAQDFTYDLKTGTTTVGGPQSLQIQQLPGRGGKK